ncbi:Polyadenylate-binding protein 1-B-binding protein [Melia azedarach]|uniref:Polyadenylate-binding protein 1-B-binding protein n=1 Tax=Melia azedarach TaxID=155640 RepID=A0ACC1XV01_MELAZ|nr:Polyadenylate-binding protein 1-B-binding protein [Melia azedarach]
MENTQQELGILGFFGILKQSFKIIFYHKKLFTQFSLAFLIPITIIFQVKMFTAVLFSFNMFKNRAEPEDITVFVIPQYSSLNFNLMASFKWTVYWFLSEIGYLILLLIFSILSTISIAHTIGSIYTSREVNFSKATALIPTIWKRVLITFLLIFAITSVYDYLLGPVLGLILRLLFFKKFTVVKLVVGIILTILYIAVFVYITIIWRLASVISVMESNTSGMKAIIKSRNLIKGKMAAAVGLFIVVLTFSAGVDTLFMLLVVYGPIIPLRIGIGILSFILKLLTILLLYVVQTVIYFVCKSYHNEDIEEEYYVADDDQKAMDVQLVTLLLD